MHVNDLIEFLADRRGSIAVDKDDGAVRITMMLSPSDCEVPFLAIGSDLGSLCEAVDRERIHYIKNRSVVPLKNGGVSLCRK